MPNQIFVCEIKIAKVVKILKNKFVCHGNEITPLYLLLLAI